MNNESDNDYILIDAPVGPYSPEDEIEAWLIKLKTMPDRTEVRFEIERAMRWLSREGSQ